RREDGEGGGDGGAIGHVEGEGAAAEGGGHGVDLGLRPAGDDHARPFGGEALGDGPADAAAAAGDEGRPAVEGHAGAINGVEVKHKEATGYRLRPTGVPHSL